MGIEYHEMSFVGHVFLGHIMWVKYYKIVLVKWDQSNNVA